MRTYSAVQSNDLVLSHSAHPYHIAVRDLPSDERPREKLIERGPQSLSMAELLAVVFGVGTRAEEVLAMSHRILREYGERAVPQQRDARMLAAAVGISLGKSAQLIACFELGRRLFQEPVKGRQQVFLRGIEQVVHYVSEMRELPKEQLRGLYLNAHYGVVHEEVLSVGTLTGSLVHPREVFQPALAYGASGVILVHNHPSGVADPSDADIAVTAQLLEAGKILGVSLLDHVIVTKHAFTSIPASYDEQQPTNVSSPSS
jgi:DNA repair protein RadC